MQSNLYLFPKNSITSSKFKSLVIMKILGLGNALVDVLVQLDNDDIINNLGFPKGGMQLIDETEIPKITGNIESLPSTMKSGGSAANTIHGLACLGTDCGFFGKVGRDELGDFYVKDLETANVETLIRRSATVTGRAYTLITPDTERTFATFLGAAVELSVEDLSSIKFEDYDILHIEGYLVPITSLLEKLMKIAKEKGLQVSIDLASYNVVEANKDFLSKLIPKYVDIVFANEEEAKAYTGQDPEAALDIIAEQCSIAVVKTGKEGSLIKSDGIIYAVNSNPVKALDTTGAGDQYAAGFLYGYSQKLDFNKCGKIGTLLAGTVIENYGARIPENLWNKVLETTEQIINGE